MSASWIEKYVDTGDFTGLFIEGLGWSKPRKQHADVKVDTDGETLVVSEVAHYRGIAVWACPVIPAGNIQRAVDNQLRKYSTERIVIFHDDDRQAWRWPQSRDSSGAGSPRLVTHDHVVGRGNEALRQRLQLIKIGLDEDPSVVETTRRLRKAFDSDKVTKDFYRKFANQHQLLVDEIEGITASDADLDSDLRWYGSLLLNRLMFIYFMQRKGFLDGDPMYLQNRMERIRELERPGSFYEFFRDFLLPLFHEGLGAKAENRNIDDPDIVALIGDVPYVNGGLFSPHVIEQNNEIRVPDSAFERLFSFFDEWQWHLDDRPTGRSNEINPDVLGYIFEQYINDRADKGAYYTKEDVTDYMVANTLVAVFLERLEAQTGVNPWRFVSADPDRYLAPSMLHGLDVELPEGVEAEGSQWPRPAWSTTRPDSELALPAESWWETADRRTHVELVRTQAGEGRVQSVESAISMNLNLEMLATDTIDALDNPKDVVVAWEILTNLRIIDPTCGSGAFLFAALNVLQHLYAAVMDSVDAHVRTSRSKTLAAISEEASRHANRDYFILKHAAIRNLYGVDIMAEAVEIARLRLFLKLIAQIDERGQIEPLPDLEFNIRPGNILVGAFDEESIRGRAGDALLASDNIDGLMAAPSAASAAYAEFSKAQMAGDDLAAVSAKSALLSVITEARDELNRWWHALDDPGGNMPSYLARARPFHWFIEFPDAMADGGFDVVIGNPPYVGAKGVRENQYQYSGFETDQARDLYAPCLERASQITASTGRMAMIVPMNLAWADGYSVIRRVLMQRFGSIWASTYDQMPQRLFDGVATRNTIVLCARGSEGLHTTSLNKWVADYRPHLLPTLRYVAHPGCPEPWGKVGEEELIPFANLKRGGLGLSFSRNQTPHRIGFKTTAMYWISAFVEDPPCLDGNRNPVPQSEVRDFYMHSPNDQMAVLAVVTSRVFFLWWVLVADAFHLTQKNLQEFPLRLEDLSAADHKTLVKTGKALQKRLAKPGDHMLWTPYKGGWYGNFDLTKCRDITENADAVLLAHFGLVDVLPAFETEMNRYMKSGGERPGTFRGALPDRDR